MKTNFCDQTYEILREEDGEWFWYAFGDYRDEGKVTLPEDVRRRLAQGYAGMFQASHGHRYWIKPTPIFTNFS
jgi:hypothetical protein